MAYCRFYNTMAAAGDTKGDKDARDVLAAIDAAVKTATAAHQGTVTAAVNAGVAAAWSSVHAEFAMQMQHALGYGKDLFYHKTSKDIAAARAEFPDCTGWVGGEFPAIAWDPEVTYGGKHLTMYCRIGVTNFGRKCRAVNPLWRAGALSSHIKQICDDVQKQPYGNLYPITIHMAAAISQFAGPAKSYFPGHSAQCQPQASMEDMCDFLLHSVIKHAHQPKSDLYLVQQQAKEVESFAEQKAAIQKARDELAAEQKAGQARLTRFLQLEQEHRAALVASAAPLREAATLLADAADLRTDAPDAAKALVVKASTILEAAVKAI